MRNILIYTIIFKNIETLSYEEDMVRCAGKFYRNVISFYSKLYTVICSSMLVLLWYHANI